MSEYDEQCTVIEWARYNRVKWPCLHWLHASLNGVRLTKGQAVKALRSGMKSGILDLCLPFPHNGYHGLYIEMKYGKGKPTENQILFDEYLTEVGYKSVFCWTSQEAIDCLIDYLS